MGGMGKLVCPCSSVEGEGARRANNLGSTDDARRVIILRMSNRLIEKQVIFNGNKVRLELHHLENEEGERVRREVCVHPGAVVILPLLDERRILLIRNRRYAVGGQILIELPAGTLEKNEDPMNCAGRGLLEETGYLAARLQPLG